MHTKRCLLWAIVAAGLVAISLPHPVCGQDEAWRRMLKATEAEQIAWINKDLDRGMPTVDPDAGVFVMLVLNRSQVVLPLIEQKIEEVLRSPSPPACFTDKSVDPQKFVHTAALAIIGAGDAQALKEASKLIKIDEEQFGWMVEQVLIQARSYRNPFVVAYRGLEIGDPAIDSRIAAWAEVELADKRPPLRNYGPRDPEPVPESEIQRVRRWWAGAMVERYRGVPVQEQWAHDPIVSRLKKSESERSSLYKEMLRYTTEATERPVKQ